MKVDSFGTPRLVVTSLVLTLFALLSGCGSSPEAPPGVVGNSSVKESSSVEGESRADLAQSESDAESDVRSAYHEALPDASEDYSSIASTSAITSGAPSAPPLAPRAAREEKAPEQDPVVVVETSLGSITIRLFPKRAPETVANFLENYVARHFYDETIVHHVERDFMIAAGGYGVDLEPKPTRAWIRNESRGGLSNLRGTVAMAHLPGYPDSATSQFFINLADNPSLDYQTPVEQTADESSEVGEGGEVHAGYCVFGEVIEGMEIIDRIAAQEVESSELFPNLPVDTVIIRSIRRIQ